MDVNPIEERVVRREKLRQMIAGGIDPYPSSARRTHETHALTTLFDDLLQEKAEVTVVGRLKAVRGHGGACFADLEDGTGKIQIHFKKDLVGAAAYDVFQGSVDRGDYLEVTGTPIVTKMGEKTVQAASFRMLAKSLAPLPDKWHGLADVELRYRRRELDLIANPEVRNIFRRRDAIVQTIRRFLLEGGYMEVETPVLQAIAGGAIAEPFVTHHNALDVDLYLRIAPELYLKRLVVGGFERVFEFARCFRNEGIDHSHNPEFTQVEGYRAYADYRDLMAMVERLLPEVCRAATGDTSVTHDGKRLDFAPPYPRIAFRDALVEFAAIDIEEYSERAALAKAAKKIGVEVEDGDDRGKIMDNIFKKRVRPAIVNPTFIIDYPVELSPLAKRTASDPKYVEMFQLVVHGTELIKAFSELNDPIDQRERFAAQEKLREHGDAEAHRLDEEYLAALEVGLPPTAGFGIGIDRLTAVLTGSHSLKEVILFPTLRPAPAPDTL